MEAVFPEYALKDGSYPVDHPFWHLASHAVADVEHGQALARGLANAIRTDEDLVTMGEGMEAGSILWPQFWVELAQEIGPVKDLRDVQQGEVQAALKGGEQKGDVS